MNAVRNEEFSLNIKKYEYFEQSFQAAFTGNPFDIDLAVIVKCPDESTKKIYGFYDGENIFTFRFMPEQIGEYSYKTICKINKLNNKTGSFTCIKMMKAITERLKFVISIGFLMRTVHRISRQEQPAMRGFISRLNCRRRRYKHFHTDVLTR